MDVMNTNKANTAPRISEWRRLARVFTSRPTVTAGGIILLLVVICAVFAKWLAPFPPNQIDMTASMVQPGVRGHLLGTDDLGRDILSRLIYGSQVALMVGMIATALSAAIGVSLGITAGYFGRGVNMVIMRITDAMMSFPNILLALIIAAVLGGGTSNLIIALTVGSIPGYIRITNGLTLGIKENEYVLAGRAMGASNLRQMATHILPNALAPIIVQMTLQIGMLILAEAGLSFLGVGISPPTSAWGSMVYQGYVYLETNPVISLAPGVAIMLVVFAFNMVGDGLRDALDPKLRGKI
jgi:peptide/nickel transport system permease protein